MANSWLEICCQIFLKTYYHLLSALILNLLKQETAFKFIVTNSFWLTLGLNVLLFFLYTKIIWNTTKVLFGIQSSKPKSINNSSVQHSASSNQDSSSARQPLDSLSFFEVVPTKKEQFFAAKEDSSEVFLDSFKNPFLEMKSTFFDRDFQFAQDSIGLLDSLGNKSSSTGKIFSISVPKTLSLFNLEHSFDLMERRLRKWISSHVLFPLHQDVLLLEKHFPSSGSLTLTSSSLESFFAASPQFREPHEKLASICAILNSHPQLGIFHSSLERFFNTIKELAAGETLELFGWNKFIFPEAEKITHSELVMALFCVYLDFQMPGEDKTSISTGPFTRGFFLCPIPQNNPSALMHHHYESLRFTGIRQTSFKPPHFDVLTKGQLYECLDGPSNAFMALLVFLSVVKREFNGYVGLLNLEGANMHRLLSVLGE